MSCKYDLSVVVIVYNTGEYLRACLNSILNQTAKNIEIIAVDDESTDNSLEILKTYKHYENFKIIEQKNQGGAVAGNNGIRQAQGEYVALVDSDDMVVADAYEKMLKFAKLNNCDIVIGQPKRLVNNNLINAGLKEERDVWKKERIIENIKNNVDVLYDGFYWNKIYSKKLLIENGIFMPDGMLFADRYFTHKAYIFANRIGIIPDIVYHWRKRDENAKHKSILQCTSEVENIKDRFESLEYQIKYIEDLNDKKFTEKFLKTYLRRNLRMITNILENLEYREIYITKMKSIFSKVTNLYENDLTIVQNLQLYLLLNDNIDELIYFVVNPYMNEAEVLTEDNKNYLCLPFFRNKNIYIPDDLFEITKFESELVKLNKIKYYEKEIILEKLTYATKEKFEYIEFKLNSILDNEFKKSVFYNHEKENAVFDIEELNAKDIFEIFVVIGQGERQNIFRLTKNMINTSEFYCKNISQSYFDKNKYLKIQKNILV